ncbi:efflux RND transporter periplasmic adaptor subunit [Panacagrimonas sp.]|uniref:efflux RND transporter periplasmic adaptor subunit n=1 Tax=Panacagrimonas sp. TaxID=2480088 RepID=UPI003B523DD1
MTTKRMLIMLVLALVLFGGVFALKYMGRQGMNAYFDSMPVPPATISASAAEAMTWDNQLEAIGSVVAVNGTDVTTEAGGIVTEIHFESGAHVKRGARLVTLDSANERGELERLKAQAELSRLNLERRKKLFDLEAISKSDLDAANAEANAARAAAQAQQALLSQKDIRAPFDGQLGIRQINLGQYLSPGTPIVSLQSVDPIEFDFSLPEQHLAVAEPGLKVELTVDGYADTTFTGEVTAVEPRVDEATRNFGLRARLPNPDHKLRAGQFGRVKLLLPGERELLAVPRTAINYSSYGTSVFVVREKKQDPATPDVAPSAGDAQATDAASGEQKPSLEVIQRFVRIGEARGDFVAVLEGLKPGERVATSGLLKLRNQQPVLIDNSVVPDAELSPQPKES